MPLSDMKKLVVLLTLAGALSAAPHTLRADEQADKLRELHLSTITRQTPRIEELAREYASFGTGELVEEQKKKRAGARSELFYALLSRGQAYEFTGQMALARADYDRAEHHGFYHNVDSRIKVDMTQLYLGQARLSLADKRWVDASVHAYSAVDQATTPMWKVEALDLESRANLYRGHIETARVRAETMFTTARDANMKSKQAVALRRVSAALFLKGDLDGARAKWKEGSTFDGRLANIDPFDPNQIALNVAIAKKDSDLEARLKRARYFNERALVLEGKAAAAQKIADDFLDSVITADGATPPPKTLSHQGGWSNIIELRNPTAESLRNDAINDADAALTSVTKLPSPLTGPLYLERARARRGLPSTPQNQLQVVDDYLEAHYLAPTDADLAQEAGRFFADTGNLRLTMRFYSLALALASRPDSRLLQQRDAIFDKFTRKPITHPDTLKTALDWKNRGNEIAGADPLNALECYRKAIEIDPKFADGWNNIASIFARYEMFDRQRDALNRAIEIDPKHRVAYANRAALWTSLHDYSKALADAERAVEYATTPDLRANALVRRAHAKAALQQRVSATEDYDAALESNPESADAWRQKGLFELRSARFGLAGTSLEKAVEREPHAQTWAALALARGLVPGAASLSQPSPTKTAWDNAIKTATRSDWTEISRLIVELYQSGQVTEQVRIVEFYRAAFAAKESK